VWGESVNKLALSISPRRPGPTSNKGRSKARDVYQEPWVTVKFSLERKFSGTQSHSEFVMQYWVRGHEWWCVLILYQGKKLSGIGDFLAKGEDWSLLRHWDEMVISVP
jgi:hypothetical protein